LGGVNVEKTVRMGEKGKRATNNGRGKGRGSTSSGRGEKTANKPAKKE